VNHELDLLSAIFANQDIIVSRAIRQDWFRDRLNLTVYLAVKDCIEAHGLFYPELLQSQGTAFDQRVQEIIDHPTPFDSALDIYIDRLEADRRTRDLREIVAKAHDKLQGPADTMTVADELIASVSHMSMDMTNQGYVKASDAVKAFLPILEDRYKSGGALPGISTGLEELDAATLGLMDKRLYYVAARPSDGKSALLLQLALTIAQQGIPVAFFSLESAMEEVMGRGLAHLAKVPQDKIATGSLGSLEFAKITDAISKVKELPLYIDDTSNATLDHIVRQSRVLAARHKVRVIFVDYVQLIRAPGETKREIVETASHTLKDIARELGVPLVAAAQLNRNSDGRSPLLGDFQHSSALEQDADTAILMEWLKTVDGQPSDTMRLHVAKNRDGRKCALDIQFLAEIMRFQNLDRRVHDGSSE
jgi:replicative DNA helicase